MSKESWKIDFGKIMEVIDRLSNVGSKLKHTSSKLKVNAISNKRHFRNNDYRKVMKDQLVQLCNKYKQRLEQIECIFAHRERVMNISESNSDTVKIQNSLKNTWCESFKVNIPSQICLRRFTSCQVSVNRISGYKLRKYKLCSNSRHISSNTLLRSLSDGDDANSLRHKQREHTPKSVKFDLEMNTETSEKNNLNNQPEKTQNVHSSKEILCSQDSDNASHSHIGALKTENKAMQQCHNRSENIIIAEGEVHDRLSDQKSCSNETPIVHQHSDSQHRINKSMNNKNVHLNCKTNGENEEKISKRHTNKTASSTASILCNEYKYINQRNNSDCDLYDVEMQEFRLAVSSDDTEIFSDNEKLQKGGCKMSVKAVTETKGCLVDKFSDAQSNKLDEIAQSDKLYKNKTNECLNKDIPDLSKKNNHEAKNTKDITLGDDAGIDRNIVKMNNERENVDVKKPEPFKQHIHKPKPKSRKAIVSSDDNKSTNNVSDKNKSVPSTLKSDEENKLVILDKDIPKLSKHNNLKPILNKEAGVSSDENKGTNNVSDNDKSMSSTLNTDDQNVYDECSDTEIHQLSKQQKSQLNSKKAIVSSDEDDYTNNVIDNDKSMTLKLKSNNENEHSKLDKNLPEFSNQHIKPKTKSKQAIVSYDEDKVTNNVSDNDSMSSTLKSDEENVHDKLDKVIPELSQKQKIKPKSKKTIISGDEEEGTNNASNIDKSMSSTLKRDQENKHDTLDTDIPEHCKKQKPKPKSKKATVSSHEDEGTNNVSDNDKSMSSTLKSDEENVHDKLDKVIPALSQKQKLKPKSKKAIISGDEEEGTNNASDNEKSMSSTLKSNEENEHDELDKDIPELFETQKPKPKSMKATVSSDEDKGTNNVSDNDTFKSLTSKTNQQNDHDKCPDTEIPVLLEQQMLKTKSKKAIVSTDEDTGTKNISDNDKSLSLTPKSNKENEHDKCLMKEVPELSKQYKNKNKNKTAIVSNEKYTEARDASAIDFIDANQRDTDKGKEAIGSGSEGNIVCRTDNENAMSDGCVDESENSSLYQDIPEQNTDISKNVDATCSLSKKDKLISHSHRKEVSSCDRKTMNDLLGRKNIGAEENTNNSSEQVTMKNKTEKNTGLHENIEDEFAKSLNDQKCKTPTLSPSPDTEVAHSGIEEIILSDTDSEPNRANDVKENDEKKVFIKCVDISKLTCQVAAKPLNMDHKKKVTNKVKDKTSDKMVTLKKTSSMPACKSVKPMVKLREFSVKVCRMQTFDQTFLKKHKLKVIKNFKTKQVVAELKQAERNERAKNDLLGDSSSSASIGRKVEPTNTTKSPSSASKRKRQRRIMRAKERLMSVSSTDTEEELVQNALKKIKRELRLSQTDKSSNELSPKKRLNKQSPYKLSSETDEMVQKALKIVSNQIKNVKYLGDSKIRDSSESDRMGRSLRRNRGNAQCEQEGTDKEENNKSPDSVIENLTNLKNIKKTARGHATSSSDDGHQAKKFKKRTSPILDEKKCEAKSDSEDEESIEEQIKSNDDVNIIEDNDDSDSLPDMPKVFRTNGKSNADLAKQELLRDSEDTSATDKADDEPSNYAHKEEKSSTDEEQQDEKKKANGRNSGKKTRSRSDRLLRGKLDLPSSSDERNSSTSGGKQQKAKVDSDKDGSEYEKAKSDSDSDDSVDFKRTAKRKPMHKKSSEKESDDSSKSSSDGQTKKKRRRIKVVAESDASDHSDSGSEGEGGKKSGRKNIRKVIRKDQLEEATKKAAREERERVARIQDRQKLYNNTAFDESGKPDEVVLDKVVLDFDPETKEPLISVDPGLVKKLKPHQANGIKFMWDACFESVKQIKKGKGSGCILAHCMGLGKTLQVVTLTHTLLAHWELTKVRRVLVVCPLSTVLNWVNEFRMWLKLADNDIELNIFELSKFKQNYERSNQMEEWMECGGVCVLGYEMFRNLSADNPKKFRKKMLRIFQESLVDPGPDLVVCDEGHLLKNEKTSLSQSMNRIKTIRRIVLTGTPLQNNLKEYYCMVQFVKQNLLGKYNEYLNRFVNPITNGQYTDSTDHDIRIMKRRSHVLHKLLDGAVQRRDYGVLAPFLPPKHEYIIFITLTDVQIKLYTYYLENLSRRPQPDRKSTSFLFPDFQAMQRIWTHPLVLKANSDRYEILQQKKRDKEDDEDSEGSLINFIDDESTTEEETTEESSEESVASDDSRPKRVKPKKKNKKHNKKARSTRANPVKPPEPSPEKEVVVEQKSENWTEWWMPLVTDEQLEDMRNSNKLLLLFQILKECEAIGDKLLVFSQSLYSLDLIEHFLGKIDEATQSGQSEENLAGHIGSWSEGLDYFRLDGQTSCENRSLWCKSFNRESNPRARLFLISTRAGGLGINLVAANRVVIFDMSWNPSHDVQSIFRVYRFGQKKPCYIYRFLAMGTMEEKIYERQVTKQAISKRVIDEQQIDRHYAENDLAELYQFTPRPDKPREVPLVPKDRLFAEMLKTHEDAIYKYHEHDSLLENKEEETLTEEERKAAWDDFENEKNRPPPPPMNYNQNYNGINNIMNPNSVAFVALANMLRRDYPQLTDQQLAAMMPSILYQADPSLYGGYDFNIMNSLMNSQYANTAMQPNLMMNPGGGMGAVGGMSGAAVGGMSSAAVGGSALRGALGGAMGGALAYQPVWQQQQQMQLQRLMQQQQQQQKSQAGMKFYAGGLGSRDPISMAMQQQKQREMILGGGASAGGILPNSNLPTRGRPPKPKPTMNNEVVTLDDSD